MQGGINMLNDYEIQKKNNSLVIATLQLFASLLVLYGAILLVPNFVEDVRTMQTASNEQVKIRVIANSSSTKDQQLKHEIVENIQSFILTNNEKLEDIHSYERIYQDIQKNYSHVNIKMQTGDNLFPPKMQNHHFYPQNKYNSVVYIIGNGRGENWFCGVFPTLCNPPEESKKEKPPSFLYDWWKKKKQKKTQT